MNSPRIALATVMLMGCTNGAAAGTCQDGDVDYECSHVEFLGHLSAEELGGAGDVLNDIWGWTDPLTGDEYVLVGMYGGTAFVRLGDGRDPRFLGRLPFVSGGDDGSAGLACHDECGEENSAWRDIKTIGHYAVIVSESEDHGMQVFDLTRLRTADAPREWTTDAHYIGIGSAHNVAVNEQRARAYIVGFDREGGIEVVDMSDPLHPTKLASVNEDGYTHDVQCVNHAGPDADVSPGNDICFASNEDTITIWDLTNPVAPVMRSRTTYPGAAYVHQAWLSEDQRYLFVNDELDGAGLEKRTRTMVFDVSDLDAPELVTEYLAPTLALDHNNYVKGRFLFQSNYTAGLRILDVLNPVAPVEAAYFRTVEFDERAFRGTWSNYPWFESGLVVLTDIELGLYVVKPTLDTSPANANLVLTLDAEDEPVTTGAPTTVTGTLENRGDVTLDEILLTLHLPNGDAFEAVDADVTCTSGRVVRCELPELEPGTTWRMSATTRRDEAGDALLIAMAYARQADVFPADNLRRYTLAFVAPEPLPEPPETPAPPADDPDDADDPPDDDDNADDDDRGTAGDPVVEPDDDAAPNGPGTSGGGAAGFFALLIVLCRRRTTPRTEAWWLPRSSI